MLGILGFKIWAHWFASRLEILSLVKLTGQDLSAVACNLYIEEGNGRCAQFNGLEVHLNYFSHSILIITVKYWSRSMV